MLVAFAWTPSIAAQSSAIVDLGVSAARFTAEGVSLIGPQIRLSAKGAQRRSFETMEVGALGTSSAALAYADAAFGVRTARASALQGDVVGELSAVGTTSSSGPATTAVLSARGSYGGTSRGGWMRLGSQLASREDRTFAGASVDAAAWWRFAESQLTASLSQEWTRAALYAGNGRTRPVGTAPVEYLEAGLSLHHEGRGAMLDLAAASRRDAGAVHRYEQSVSGSAAYWTSEATAVVLTVARQLPDYVRGADAVDAVSVGVRFGQAAPSVARAALRLAIVQLSGTADTRTLRVHVADARTVEIMGDFTNWEARAMTRNGPTFESTMRLTSGTHRIVVRIDGGAWRPPANTPAVDDDFGGRVGLLVVP